MNQENFCNRCGGVKPSLNSNARFKETYTYQRNQPKNSTDIVLTPMPNYIKESYGYEYATYKPPRHEKLPSVSEEKEWPGII